VATTLTWAELAGDRLPKVVEFQLYQQKKPEDFTPELLRTVLNLDTIETVNKVTPLPSDQLTRLITFADTNFVRLVNRLSAEEISQLASYLATTAAPPAGLASDLASGQQTVAALLAIPEAEPTAAAATPDSTGFPSMALIWQFVYANSIVVAVGVILLAGLLLAVISAAGRRRGSGQPSAAKQAVAPAKPQPSPKPKPKQKRKPRDVYDIFHDG
jgi:hypothetical protein